MRLLTNHTLTNHCILHQSCTGSMLLGGAVAVLGGLQRQLGHAVLRGTVAVLASVVQHQPCVYPQSASQAFSSRREQILSFRRAFCRMPGVNSATEVEIDQEGQNAKAATTPFRLESKRSRLRPAGALGLLSQHPQVEGASCCKASESTPPFKESESAPATALKRARAPMAPKSGPR